MTAGRERATGMKVPHETPAALLLPLSGTKPLGGSPERLKRIRVLLTLVLFIRGSAGVLPAQRATTEQTRRPTVLSGDFYDTAQDLQRFRAQATDPELAAVYANIRQKAADNIQSWSRRFSVGVNPRSTTELIEAGRSGGELNTGYEPLVLETVLDPTERNKQVLREMMLFAIGTRQKLNYWNVLGIHEAIDVSEFLETYGIANQVGVFTAGDHAAIKEEMHQAGHFLDGWLLDNPYSRMYPDKRDTAWCLNFHIMSASTLTWIAMLYPEFPESAQWLREGQSAIIEYMMNGYAEDGAYSEGSDHYWQLATKGMLNFFTVSRNLGVSDYLQVPAIADRMRASLHWRINLTSPDGNQFAIGDSDRTNDAGSFLLEAGTLLHDAEAQWAGRMMMERANRWTFRERSPLFFAHLDLSVRGKPADNTNALFPISGFATFRSGWGEDSNAMFFKYGPTYGGRRQEDREPVISGHAHEDALEFELHYHGHAVLADIGRHGRYEDWATYGGFMKATIAHSTIGLGNPWGLDRLDGDYARHQAEHGADFTYEQTQQNIDPADSRLVAYADLGTVAFSSARVRTYDPIYHQRSLVWFAEDSLTIVADHLESAAPQPYEWYLTPVGKPLETAGKLVFGDETAKLEVVPIAPLVERATSIGPGTRNLPPYYIDLASKSDGTTTLDSRSSTFSLLVLQHKASTTDFLNVLLPFAGAADPWSVERLDESTRRLRLGSKEVLVAGRDAKGVLSVTGECGVLSQAARKRQSYALIPGTELRAGDQVLVSSTLATPVWQGLYSTTLNALVSLPDHRASFDLRPWRGDQHLLLNPPRAMPGQEPTATLLTAVSFYVSQKPQRMLVYHGFAEQPNFNDPAADVWANWPRDWHSTVARREPLEFTYDSVTRMVTVKLEPGPNQVVWQ